MLLTSFVLSRLIEPDKENSMTSTSVTLSSLPTQFVFLVLAKNLSGKSPQRWQEMWTLENMWTQMISMPAHTVPLNFWVLYLELLNLRQTQRDSLKNNHQIAMGSIWSDFLSTQFGDTLPWTTLFLLSMEKMQVSLAMMANLTFRVLWSKKLMQKVSAVMNPLIEFNQEKTTWEIWLVHLSGNMECNFWV